MVGLRWLLSHQLLRTLAILLAVLNASSGAADGVLVLYSLEVLHLSNFGFGVLLSLLALGGLLGTVLSGPINRRFGLRTVAIGSASIEGALLLAVGLSSALVTAALAMFFIGTTSMVWNVLTVSLRQRIVPAELLGRVTSSYRVIGLGAMPIGAVLAGLLAKAFTLHTPYLLSGIAILVATLACLPFIHDPVTAGSAAG